MFIGLLMEMHKCIDSPGREPLTQLDYPYSNIFLVNTRFEMEFYLRMAEMLYANMRFCCLSKRRCNKGSGCNLRTLKLLLQPATGHCIVSCLATAWIATLENTCPHSGLQNKELQYVRVLFDWILKEFLSERTFKTWFTGLHYQIFLVYILLHHAVFQRRHILTWVVNVLDKSVLCD